MWSKKMLVTLFVVCFVNLTLSSPVTNNGGRGIGTTIWEWITYPFTWWSYGTENDQSIEPSPNEPLTTIEIGKRNVTVWCNDQTCTTMRCDKFGCTNLTCNIYDTDLTGECRIYNTMSDPDLPATPVESSLKPNENLIQNAEKPVKVTDVKPSILAVEDQPLEAVEDKPLELEMMLSSTVEGGSDKVNSPEKD